MTLLHRTPLNRDFTTSMIENAYARFMEDMATTVQYRKFSAANTAHPIYKEQMAKTYDAPKDLLAKVRLNPSPKYLQENGIIEKVDAIFIFSQKQLDDESVTITHKDTITFKSVLYYVIEVSPLGQLQDKNFFRLVQCLDTPEKK